MEVDIRKCKLLEYIYTKALSDVQKKEQTGRSATVCNLVYLSSVQLETNSMPKLQKWTSTIRATTYYKILVVKKSGLLKHVTLQKKKKKKVDF